MILAKLIQTDLKVSNWIYHHRKKWLTRLLIIITNTMERWIFIPVFLSLLWIVNSFPNSFFIFGWFWLMAFGTFIFNSALKHIFKRPRPNESRLVIEKHYSFPSGHVMSAIQISFQSLFLYIQSVQPVVFPIHFLFAAILFVLMIAFSRVYLGVHYVSDTVGSLVFGSVSVAVSIMVFGLFF